NAASPRGHEQRGCDRAVTELSADDGDAQDERHQVADLEGNAVHHAHARRIAERRQRVAAGVAVARGETDHDGVEGDEADAADGQTDPQSRGRELADLGSYELRHHAAAFGSSAAFVSSRNTASRSLRTTVSSLNSIPLVNAR